MLQTDEALALADDIAYAPTSPTHRIIRMVAILFVRDLRSQPGTGIEEDAVDTWADSVQVSG